MFNGHDDHDDGPGGRAPARPTPQPRSGPLSADPDRAAFDDTPRRPHDDDDGEPLGGPGARDAG